MNNETKQWLEKNLTNRQLTSIDLSAEILSLEDYVWLKAILEKACFVETLILPALPKQTAALMISHLKEALRTNTLLVNLKFNLSELDKPLPDAIATQIKQINSCLARNKKRVFAIHGGGNIGLGVMAEISTNSTLGYQTIATSNQQFTNHLINTVRQFHLQHSASSLSDTTPIANVYMIPRDSKSIELLYIHANIAALCVTSNVLTTIAPDIARGLIKRYQIDGAGLKILILMNKPQCDQFVKQHIAEALLKETGSQDLTEKILSGIIFVPTVVDRIVNGIKEDEVKKQLRQQLMAINPSSLLLAGLIQTELALASQIEAILNSSEKLNKAVKLFNLKIPLFNAEKNSFLYVPDTLAEAHSLPGVKIMHDLEQVEALKNKFINGPHAILAWMGALMGCLTIADSIRHPYIFPLIKKMMEQEIAPILNKQYPQISCEELVELTNAFFERCRASINDLVIRVGRDPLRKLDANGRILGTLAIAKKYGVTLETTGIKKGIACGILYGAKGVDANNSECQKIAEIYQKNFSYKEILCYQGPGFLGLHPDKDKNLINEILMYIAYFEGVYDAMHNNKTSVELLNKIHFSMRRPKKIIAEKHHFQHTNKSNSVDLTSGLKKYNFLENNHQARITNNICDKNITRKHHI